MRHRQGQQRQAKGVGQGVRVISAAGGDRGTY